jgi:hypothetical protein
MAVHQGQLTLRDYDEHRVLARLDAVLRHFPGETAPATPHGEDWCHTHGVSMTLNHGKNGRTWYSHRTADGWYKGKRVRHA